MTGDGGKVRGDIGLSTSIKHIRKEGHHLVGLIQKAAEEASSLLK